MKITEFANRALPLGVAVAWVLLLASACSGESTPLGPPTSGGAAGAGDGSAVGSCETDAQCDASRGLRCFSGKCSTGQFEACTLDAECDGASGFRCVDGECRVRCDSHFECGPSARCESRGEHGYCERTEPAPPGQFYSVCPQGDADCDSAAGFLCVSAGVGDLDSYCTKDCTGDADCAEGFRCGTLGVTPCTDSCGVPGQKTADCVPSSEIGPGQRYQCGATIGVERRVCRKREFCSTCERDEDCFAVAGQICAKDESGTKICTFPCDPSVAGCPWGDATQCGLYDSDRGIYTCSHRFGACRGEGNGCEPCVDGEDCPTGFCSRASFTGEQFCIDLAVECDCGDDANADDTCTGHGCPDSPGGLHMICYAGSRYIGDPLSHRCIGANSISTVLSNPQSGCWRG